MAFQPIVNMATRQIFAQEALVRGLHGESAGYVLAQVTDKTRYDFDQACRVKAVELAARLNIQSDLSINFLPNAVYHPENCIQTTLMAAKRYQFPLDRIIFEFTESEEVKDLTHLRSIVEDYKRRGFRTAIDDFGAGHSGLNLLADFQTDYIKLDMALTRHIDQDNSRQAIVKGIVQVCRELCVELIAEGIETYEEMQALQDMGIELLQGFYFAKPSWQSLATVHWPA
nr:EAL domain-containing protein [Halomicronema hongdechloris]